MQAQLREADFSKFKAIHKNTLEKVTAFNDDQCSHRPKCKVYSGVKRLSF